MAKIEFRWKPSRENNQPIYKQIVDFIKERVACGDWPAGTKLPSQRELAADFNVNRSTLVTAMEILKSYGIIEGDFGGGTRIAGDTWSLLMTEPPDWNKYIVSGPFKANQSHIQTINQLEFDPKYIRIGTGELSPELYPHQVFSKIIGKLPKKIPNLGYLGPLGLPRLGQVLSERLKDQEGIDVSPRNILVTSGSLQGLQLISVCMLKRGSRVFTEAPTYLKSLQVFQSAGMNLEGIPMDNEGMEFWNIKGDNSNSMVYTIPTYQNPTGIVMSEERRKSLLGFCRNRRLPLLEDNAYGQLWLEKKPPLPMKAVDSSGTVLYTGTVSKNMAPGLRIGWVVGPEAVVERLGDVKMQTDYGASSLSQWFLTELLQSDAYDDYMDKLRIELRNRRDHTLKILDKYYSDLATWEKPLGGFYIWLRFKKKISMERLFKDALKANILLNPGNIYDYEENNAIRLSYAYADPQELEKALKNLGEILVKML